MYKKKKSLVSWVWWVQGGVECRQDKIRSRRTLSGLSLQGQEYKDVRMSVLKDLVKDVILGETFTKQHSAVIFKFGGPKPSLVVSSLSPIDVELPPMFTYLHNKVIIIYPSVGKYCFPNRDSSRYFSARARYERVLKQFEMNRGLEIVLSNTLGK